MAKFIGSDLHTGNWGEDYFIEKLMEYLDDTYVIYRNRPIFGAQFDVALFAPRVGIIIFEVKAWKPDTIMRVKNGDCIVIKTINPDTEEEVEAEETSLSDEESEQLENDRILEESEDELKRTAAYLVVMLARVYKTFFREMVSVTDNLDSVKEDLDEFLVKLEEEKQKELCEIAKTTEE
jgi:hypothetical protein